MDRQTHASLHNEGVAAAFVGDLRSAERLLRQALSICPENPETMFSLAKVLLGLGRLEEAWPLYEARRALPRLEIPRLRGLSEWRGEPLDGRPLYVLGEQGFGDQILFARYLPPGATYVCGKPIASLFTNAIAAQREMVLSPDGRWCLVGSLPLLTARASIPSPAQLDVPAQEGLGVGVMTLTNPSVADDPRRLSPMAAERLLALGRDLSPQATGARDFRETAEIIAGLSLVITVDTALAHLSASLGKPTWILVPDRNVYWTWTPFGTRSPWHPAATLYRKAGAWDDAIAQIERDLDQLRMNTARTRPSPPFVETPPLA